MSGILIAVGVVLISVAFGSGGVLAGLLLAGGITCIVFADRIETYADHEKTRDEFNDRMTELKQLIRDQNQSKPVKPSDDKQNHVADTAPDTQGGGND